MAIIHGGKIQIFNASGTSLLAASNSCVIRKQGEAIEVASATSQTDREFITGRSSWSIDMDYLITTGLDGIPLVNTKYQIKVMVNGTQSATGYVICTECDVQAPMNGLSKGTIRMQGTGPLS